MLGLSSTSITTVARGLDKDSTTPHFSVAVDIEVAAKHLAQARDYLEQGNTKNSELKLLQTLNAVVEALRSITKARK